MMGRVFGWGVFLDGDLHHPLEIKASLSIIYILTMAQVPDTFSHLRHVELQEWCLTRTAGPFPRHPYHQEVVQ